MNGIALQSVGLYFAALLGLFLLGWILAMPGRKLLRFLIHAASGGLLLLLFKWAASVTGVDPSINPATLAACIFLGAPGAILAVGVTAFIQARR